jgi:hypothetical protein
MVHWPMIGSWVLFGQGFCRGWGKIRGRYSRILKNPRQTRVFGQYGVEFCAVLARVRNRKRHFQKTINSALLHSLNTVMCNVV